MHVGARILHECECVYINIMHICVRTQLFLSFFFFVTHLNEMHLDIYNFIMPCNNISLCDGKQAMRGHALGEEGFFFFDTTLR